MNNGATRNIEEIVKEVKALPFEQQVELVQKLLGNSGLVVTVGNNSLRADSITQINIMSREDASEMLRAVAARIAPDEKSAR